MISEKALALTDFFFPNSRSSQSDPHRLENFKHSFPKSMKDKKRAIVVRHPMERLVSVYRYNLLMVMLWLLLLLLLMLILMLLLLLIVVNVVDANFDAAVVAVDVDSC